MLAYLEDLSTDTDDTVSFNLWKVLLVLAIIALIVYILRHRRG